ncbi:tRNA pseudouridine(55) synthase TruB [Paenibacillus mucilaginosus]|uniref:tRNA pseudouridine synthase B n=2 Tax=Paenibacillus mucilaginosus TaxID=61624 RepID=H6NPC3_9BACL|nr:tRNA pseudouridine(55) synthase TruB [Paenibacillus mucilaginosus]AEI44292.1 tRNA pseudouridine synthase B [Paenibacillus mucilaginosus KNP414]AFC31833.1 tRNA pseudouridine synthase B [Paenibacillus mucilaginosus 3016]MCG7216699.1 tRNA pseudouridine(55) synthase TruB [Paenibacillus mucilaginosus]WDM25690.1 tRNA pseudouridine(55) synthase TruB [Paenibacillus mucilaginosus]WFA20345.1 tRNA pseudouridine(55) synthase TruB [Paenibacillus mucilaginosus]
MTLEGILPVWKPAGFTSHDVVAKVRRILKIKRIGHTGTLDPQVTGVLPLCIGRATRLVEYIQELPKEYEATLRLGIATDTEDLSGSVLRTEDGLSLKLTPEEVTEAIHRFTGEIEQVPPMYSAVKVDGKRLYDLARQGVEVERKARRVTIHKIEVLSTDWTGDYPEVRFRVLCSKGTYIRTLCVDIGAAIGVPAVMAELVRTSTGQIRAESCLTLEQIEELQREGLLQQRLVPMERALSHLPEVLLNEVQTQKALQGQKIRVLPSAVSHLTGGETAAVFSPTRELIGIYEWDPVQGLLIPNKIFS